MLKPLGHKHILERELEGFGIRLNKKPPNIYFKQKEKGGLAFSVQCPQTELDKELVASVLKEYKIHNADVILNEDSTWVIIKKKILIINSINNYFFINKQ